MYKTRFKIPLPAISTRHEAEETMNSLASSANARRKCVAEMDQRILALKKEYEAGMGVLDKAIEFKSDALQAWASANPDEFPKGRKSIEFLSGTLGFRTGTYKLALLNRQWNWEGVLLAVQSHLPNFIRNSPEIDKAAILNQRNDFMMPESIQRCGMKVDQGESFYIEPNLTN
jgi:phage host-nuclease inhibitor protein Gam